MSNHPYFDTFTIVKNIKTSELKFVFQNSKESQTFAVGNFLYVPLMEQLGFLLNENYNLKSVYELTYEDSIILMTWQFAGTVEQDSILNKPILAHLDFRIIINTYDADVGETTGTLCEFIKPDISLVDIYAMISAICPVHSLNTVCSLSENESYSLTLFSNKRTRYGNNK